MPPPTDSPGFVRSKTVLAPRSRLRLAVARICVLITPDWKGRIALWFARAFGLPRASPVPAVARMSEPTLSVLIPTTGRRPDLLRQVIAGFSAWPAVEIEILQITGLTWGEGLNQLTRQAHGRWWLTCCDDTVPIGTLGAARKMLDLGYMPVQRYFTVEGEPLHEYDTAPHMTPLPWSRGYLLT